MARIRYPDGYVRPVDIMDVVGRVKDTEKEKRKWTSESTRKRTR